MVWIFRLWAGLVRRDLVLALARCELGPDHMASVGLRALTTKQGCQPCRCHEGHVTLEGGSRQMAGAQRGPVAQPKPAGDGTQAASLTVFILNLGSESTRTTMLKEVGFVLFILNLESLCDFSIRSFSPN